MSILRDTERLGRRTLVVAVVVPLPPRANQSRSRSCTGPGSHTRFGLAWKLRLLADPESAHLATAGATIKFSGEHFRARAAVGLIGGDHRRGNMASRLRPG